jgi:uncharacterized protein with von Willebrand factor type A (vWA) domain
MNQYQIIPGSIGATAAQNKLSIAETFLNAEVIIVVDTSGSMSDRDSRGGKSRYDVACDELRALQGSMPGKIAVISFSSDVIFNPTGIPQYQGGGTDLAKALRFCKQSDVPGIRFILISDGQPDDPSGALAMAKTYVNKISTIYCGPEDRPTGRDFLEKLAKLTGGETTTADRAMELGRQIMHLLGSGNVL